MNKYDKAHMKVAEIYANLSSAVRLKVGAIVVKDDRVISIGYNGTPSGWDNNCENMKYKTDNYIIDPGGPQYEMRTMTLTTNPEVVHAEANAIGKLAKSSESGNQATLYITHSPCFECAKLIHVVGINKVFYRNQYRNTDGIDFLKKCNIKVEQLGE